MTRVFSESARKYFENGFPIIPLAPRDKKPNLSGWSRYCGVGPTEEEITRWELESPHSNIGLPCGSAAQVIALDIDTDDVEVWKLLNEIIPPSPVRKRGKKGETRFYRFTGETSWKFKIDTSQRPLVELLSTGNQTVLPPSIHPETNEPYQWMTPDTLENFAAAALPVLPSELLAQLRKVFSSTAQPISVGPGGRTDRLKGQVVAALLKGKERDQVASEVYEYDLKNHNPPLFSDREDSQAKSSDAMENAKNFVESIGRSIESKGMIKTAQSAVNSIFNLNNKQNKQSEAAQLAESYKALTIPITENELRANLMRKPNHIKSGFTIEGEPLYIPSGAITILAAPTSHGKTSFQLNLALNMATDIKNKPIYLFSYEESREAILLKALNTYVNKELSKNSRRSIESYFKNESGFISEKHLAEFESLKERFFAELIATGRLNVHYVNYSAEALVGAIEYLHKHSEIGAVFIDYMQLLNLTDSRTSSRQEEVKQICITLNDCAVDTGLPIILGAQFNRTVTSIDKIHATAIGEAGDIERVASLIIGFWNKQFPEIEKTFEPTPEIYATILKGRDIQAGGKEQFIFDGNTGKISNKSQTTSMFK